MIVEEEKKRRKEVEEQLAALQKEKQAAMAAVIAERDSQAEATKRAGGSYHGEYHKSTKNGSFSQLSVSVLLPYIITFIQIILLWDLFVNHECCFNCRT